MRTKRVASCLVLAATLLVAAFWALGLSPGSGLNPETEGAGYAGVVTVIFVLGVVAGIVAPAALRIRSRTGEDDVAVRYRQFIDGINGLEDGIVFFDEDSRLVLCNQRYREIYHPASRNWPIGTGIEQIARDTARYCLGYREQHEIDAFVANRLAAHKATRAVEQQLENGNCIRAAEHRLDNGWRVGTRTDVTSLKQREKELERAKTDVEESERRFRTIAETVPVAIGISRLADGTIFYVNNRWRRMHAVRDDQDVVGQTAASLYKTPGDRTKFRAQLEAEGEVQDLELEFVRLDGKTIAVSLSARVVAFEGERAVLSAFQDITERRKAEKELKSASLQAEAANTAKSSFIATMSHELRTPLNAIIGMSDVMLESQPTERQREDIGIIREAGNALLSIIDDILDISKIEAGKLELDMIAFELNDVLASVSNLLRPNAEEKGLTLASSIADDVPTFLYGDYGRLRQIVLNIAANAVKFTDQGTVSIAVTAVAMDGEDVQLRFEVTDTGIGIPQSVQVTLFDRFMQADASTTRRFGGTGLGLAICKELCGLMNGRVGVESTIGEGSKFWFTVQLRRANAKQHAEDEKTPDRFLGKPSDLPRLRILLAEDSKINQKVIAAILSKAGHKVDIVENGIEAVNAIQDSECDLVLMDVQMPEMDGIAATKAIRAFGGDRAAVPIVALTANAMKGDREACIDAGMNEYVTKPIDPQQLARAIHRACGAMTKLENPVGSAAESGPTPAEPDIEGEMSELFDKLDGVAGRSG